MSESLLGEGPESMNDPKLVRTQTAYAFTFSTPLTESACGAATQWNVSNRRGFAWVNGEYRCALYNHYWRPNSASIDCIAARMVGDITVRYAGYGWRAARSNHPGGVNAVYADGSVH